MKWAPIESAPRDTPILVTDGKSVVCIKWTKCAGDDWAEPVGFGGWEWDWDFHPKELTHWMPAPPLPEKS